MTITPVGSTILVHPDRRDHSGTKSRRWNGRWAWSASDFFQGQNNALSRTLVTTVFEFASHLIQLLRGEAIKAANQGGIGCAAPANVRLERSTTRRASTSRRWR